MKVKASITRYEDVDISARELRDIVYKVILEVCDMPPYSPHIFITPDGILTEEWEVSAGAHSYYESKAVRPATPLDRAAILVLEAVRKAKLQ